MRNSSSAIIGSIALFAASTLVSGVGQTAEEGSWSNAGEQTREAASAVGNATANTAGKAWDATKEGASETYDAAREAVK